MTRIIKFKINFYDLREQNGILSDTIRMAFYKEDPFLFDLLEYGNDIIFLEPSLFCFFLSNIKAEDKIPLLQSILGYIDTEKRLGSVVGKADRFGMLNLPNLGYIRSDPYGRIHIELNRIEATISDYLLKGSTIRLCLHPTDLLAYAHDVSFYEPVEETLFKNEASLFEATIFFQKQLPDFWSLIESVTREFVVFSSPNHNSFAGIMHHGTAYFNTENKLQTPVFFIDDIAHQCGHIIFNVLTLDTPKYLRVPKDHPLKNYSSNPGEMRGAYGAFHGLFTYTCILHALDEVFQSQYFADGNLRFETLGRIGFYLHKFYLDLKLMDNPEILTDAGLDFHRQFTEGFDIILARYKQEIQGFDYNNQSYTFQYDRFKESNLLPKNL